jgi:hypothetical protein
MVERADISTIRCVSDHGVHLLYSKEVIGNRLISMAERNQWSACTKDELNQK